MVVMRIFQQKIISLLLLLSLCAVLLGPLWIGQAEARLGIEICTAQGVKVINAPASLAGEIPVNQDKTNHESIAPCLICAHNNQQTLLPPVQDFSFLYVTSDIAPLRARSQMAPRNSPIATTLQPRAPPASIL
tara:strand:+ start:134946 stop:135344 length:399 start_codon:yes stop_codon:yes gene_type:complete